MRDVYLDEFADTDEEIEEEEDEEQRLRREERRVCTFLPPSLPTFPPTPAIPMSTNA